MLVGQGASLAMAGAAMLARALNECGRDVTQAFARYERGVRPLVERKQRAGRRLAGWFLPTSQWRLIARNAVLRATDWPGMMHLMGRSVIG